MIGEKISHYQLTDEIDYGWLGKVYRAKNSWQDNQVFAIRLLCTDITKDKLIINSLLESISKYDEIAKKLSSLSDKDKNAFESIVRVVELVKLKEPLGEGYAQIMPYAKSDATLAKKIKDKELWMWRVAIDDILKLLSVLDFAHRQGIHHIGIRPDKVIITNTVKIRDFGMLGILWSLKEYFHSMQNTMYMSPEQVSGQRGDEKSDIYSTALIFYEALGGPLTNDDVSLLDFVEAKKSKVPRLNRNDVPKELITLIEKGLAINPEQRFTSISDFITALEDIKNSAQFKGGGSVIHRNTTETMFDSGCSENNTVINSDQTDKAPEPKTETTPDHGSKSVKSINNNKRWNTIYSIPFVIFITIFFVIAIFYKLHDHVTVNTIKPYSPHGPYYDECNILFKKIVDAKTSVDKAKNQLEERVSKLNEEYRSARQESNKIREEDESVRYTIEMYEKRYKLDVVKGVLDNFNSLVNDNQINESLERDFQNANKSYNVNNFVSARDNLIDILKRWEELSKYFKDEEDKREKRDQIDFIKISGKWTDNGNCNIDSISIWQVVDLTYINVRWPNEEQLRHELFIGCIDHKIFTHIRLENKKTEIYQYEPSEKYMTVTNLTTPNSKKLSKCSP